MKKTVSILLFVLAVVFLYSKSIVAVSIVPQENFVKKVGGDNVEVITMIPPGYSPANYAPTPKELMQFSDAEIYFTIGVPTEKVNILPEVESFNEDMKVVSLQDEVEKIYPARYFSPETRDPHIWMSPKRAIVMVDTIQKELSALDPQNEEYYKSNAEKYKNELYRLDEQLKEITENMSNRTFFIFHPALGYFADDYNLNMYALEKDGKDATPKTLQELIDIAKKENIRVIFYQAEIDSKQTAAFAEEIGGKSLKVNPLSADYISNLENIAETFSQELN
jgi:zinc transport system substrate-binding protein